MVAGPPTDLARTPTLGSKEVKLNISLGNVRYKETLADELRDMFQKGLCCDVVFLCEGQSFRAHKAVLGARSAAFRTTFEGEATTAVGATVQEVRLSEVNNPEAVKFMLEFVYEVEPPDWKAYHPASHDITKDILSLSRRFELPGLTARAEHWLSKDITTGDVVERLCICRDFRLEVLKSKILEQLTSNRAALAEVASGSKIMQYPELMQMMLQQAAASIEEDDEEPAPKKAKKGRGKDGR
ncbi:unnamed protein product [Polarella glacialis]|uniref:BTB domain-containing protein n=1 Tax=Polarella glacialis TaxID=89957 RepID=A0A813K1K3_POLGL|nr:unnamed protein product [Polarella glacialis]|mmetsp:Transcript_30979/g.55465  ORF Transcript_30979/g.55465 Transcript_30979/m.55465 type:complete len:241 (+) Transcript_30979:119-841(+)